jgi:hypothetical protein
MPNYGNPNVAADHICSGRMTLGDEWDAGRPWAVPLGERVQAINRR